MKKLKIFPLFIGLLYCKVEYTNQSECGHLITDFSQQTCINKADQTNTYYYWKSDCIPYCQVFNKNGYEGDDCPCPPGYECDKRCSNSKLPCQTTADCTSGRDRCKDQCVQIAGDTLQCMAYHANTFEYEKTYYTAKKFKPKCTNSGEWEAKQCKGGIGGRCFCFDAIGKRLFGQARYTDSKNMTCSCSRKKADLLAGGRNYVSFHCDQNGNYEELQCDSDLCWCVETQTGKLTSPVVPQRAMIKLPCYKAADIGGQYLRKCESITYANAAIEKILRNHGMIYVNMGNIQCDGDGAYGVYNISGSIARCTKRDGTQIGSWQGDASTDVSKLNCNCARDYQMYNHQLTCNGNGNYQSVQTVIDNGKSKFFCVDSDGFPKTDLFNDVIDNCTAYY